MKPEDLKVGMLFEKSYNSTMLYQHYYYYIFKITKAYVFVLIYTGEFMTCQTELASYFCATSGRVLIDKVPPKIVEVEEEVPVYMPKINYECLSIGGSVSGGPYPQLSTYHSYGERNDYVELCKIKRTVKKELNFSWEKGEYEDE